MRGVILFPTFLVGNFFMRRPVQWNYAAGAAHGSRSEQEKKRSCLIGRQNRAVELVEQRAGEKAFLLDLRRQGRERKAVAPRVKFYK